MEEQTAEVSRLQESVEELQEGIKALCDVIAGFRDDMGARTPPAPPQAVQAPSPAPDALAQLERQYAAVRTTKGPYGESERKRILAAIARLKA